MEGASKAWFWSTDVWGQFLMQLAAVSRVSWSWCQPTDGWDQGPGHLGAGSDPLVGRAKNQALWLWGPVILELVSAICCEGPGPKGSQGKCWPTGG